MTRDRLLMATEVRAWRARAGGRTVSAPRRGFETALRLEGTAREVVVEALGEGGRVLGASASVAVTRPD